MTRFDETKDPARQFSSVAQRLLGARGAGGSVALVLLFIALSLAAGWVQAHHPPVQAAFRPGCRRLREAKGARLDYLGRSLGLRVRQRECVLLIRHRDANTWEEFGGPIPLPVTGADLQPGTSGNLKPLALAVAALEDDLHVTDLRDVLTGKRPVESVAD